jgi:hypothetical protein
MFFYPLTKVKGVALGKNYINIKLDNYTLKIGETLNMTIKVFKNDLYLNFKYAGS